MLIDGKITSGVQHFKRKPKEPRGKTISEFIEWSKAKLLRCSFDLVVYEKPLMFFRGQAATFFGVGFAAIVEGWAYEFHSPVITENVQTIKGFAAGAAKITEGKSQTLARAQQFDPSIASDDQADALCLLLYVMTQKAIPIPPHGQGE
jgi:hypothetical protein